eukprot:NODE_11063_length_268_cov_87.205479_g9293_i0.p2 GENE.NODE_11063_length_268_cov_87.205479_g9293_i0~~NODE_11063_length_268_cov_87.205479_g9293_i0.p2  ORF type:complete len:57 (-),score=12.13 NODE_11063_length_268_cov_87.205479_g9293_i0:98-244(-)
MGAMTYAVTLVRSELDKNNPEKRQIYMSVFTQPLTQPPTYTHIYKRYM